MITLDILNNNNALAEYVKNIEKNRHIYYDKTVDHAEKMGVHVEGFEPTKLLRQKRPNEPEEIRDYRLQNWKAITKSETDKVINTVARIMNPKLFKLEFPDSFRGEPTSNTLSDFLKKDYGVYGSIWGFVQETLIKLTFSDPNAVCLVMPTNYYGDDAEYYTPMPFIYRSEYVIDFKDGEYFTLYFEKDDGANKICFITKEFIAYVSVKKRSVVVDEIIEHDLGVCPAYRLGGQAEGDYHPYWYSSLIAGIQPHWDKVVTMTSDMDASIVNHLFPERYEWQDECERCKGSGKVDVDLGIEKKEQRSRDCYRCAGAGYVNNKSPFGIYSIKRDAINPDLPSPIPPAGYITKDIEPMRELKVQIKDEVYKGFCAINMEVLHKVGADQSGVAKAIDREDLDGFLMRVSNHIFDYSVRKIIEITARWRYGAILDANEYVKEIKLSKPQEFGAITIDMLVNELKDAGKVSPNYYRQIEAELINRKFANNQVQLKKNLTILKLTPFPSKTIDELLSANAIGAVKKRDIIRNENIDELVTKAIIQNADFLELDFNGQLEIINGIIEAEYEEAPFIPATPINVD